MDKKQISKRCLAFLLSIIMIIGMMPLNIFAETYKTKTGEIKTTDWEPTEENLKGKNFWPLGNKQYLREVSRVAEPMKNPILHYEGYFTRPDGRTVIRLTMRKFDKVGSGVWHVMQMKLEDSLFDKIDWQDTQTGIYKGTSKDAVDGWYHDDIAYKEITPFGDTNIINAGTTNVKEINIANNGNTASGPSTNEVPINLVLKEEFNIGSFDHEPLAQMRLLDKSKKQVAAYTDADTNLANYSTYTFSSILPIKNNYKQNLLRERRNNNTSVRFMKGANSSIYYNKEKGYLEVTQNYNKSSLPNNKYYGAHLGYRQTVDKKFYDALKPIDADGTIAHIYSTSNNGLPTSGRLDKDGNPTSAGAVPVLKRNINFPEGSNMGFIQIANTDFYREQEAQQGIKTNITTLQPLDSWFDGVESLVNGGQGTVVRYYVDNEKVEKWLNESDDGLSFSPFYSSVIRDNEEGYTKYEFTLDEDQELKPGDTINIEFQKSYGNGTGTNGQGTDGLKTMTMFFTVKGEGNDMYLGTNFYHMGNGVAYVKDNGKKYEYRIQNGMPMNLKKGTKVTLYTVFDTGGDAVFKFNNSQTVRYPAKMQKDHSPIEFEWQGTFSAGTIAVTYFKPDVDEIFLGDENITGRTLYENGEVNIKKHVADKDFQTIIAKPGNTNNKDDSRIEVEVNGKKQLGYEFDTKTPGMKKDGKTARTFKMPELERDMPILFTNTNVQNLAEESRPPVIEQVQTKFHFDLNGVKSKTNLDVLDKIVPLSKEYKYDPATGEINPNYKASGFEGDNVKYADEKNKTIKVDDRTYQNVANHDGLAYDLKKTDQKEAFLMRQMPTKDDINVPQGKRILGWTTTKLEDIPNGKTAIEQFNELKDNNKVVKGVADWAKVDAKENYIFDANSPIDKERTVYAVYGEGINIVLHSNNTDDPKKETTITIPVTVSDIDNTNDILDAVTSPTLSKMKGNLVIKELPKVPVTGEDSEIDKITDTKAKLFNKPNHSFLGWTLYRFDNDPQKSDLIAGQNNERIGELINGVVAGGTKRIPKRTEWIKDITGNTNKYTRYIPNTFSVALRSEDVPSQKNNEGAGAYKIFLDAIDKGEDLHLYANYRPFFDVKVYPSYKNIDKNQGEFGKYVNTVEDAKKHSVNVGLLHRTAVTNYGTPTVHQNANYYPLQGGADSLKTWDGKSTDPLVWKLPGFDELGQRKSYVSVIVPDDKKDAYANFESPNWDKLGAKTYIRLQDETATQDPNAPKNLHENAGNPYGDPVAKDQTFTAGVDAFTSATSRKALETTGEDKEVIGYEIWNTSTPLEVLKPVFDNVYEDETEAKLHWTDAEKNAGIKKIILTVADGAETTLVKQNDGTYTDGTITATSNGDKLVLSPLDLTGKAGQDIVAKYVVEKNGQEVTGPEGRITINERGTSAPVEEMKQIPNDADGKSKIEFKVPDPVLNKPTKGTVYTAQKWDETQNKWVDLGKVTLDSDDDKGTKKEITLDGDVKDGDIVRIKSEQPNLNPSDSTGTGDANYTPQDGDENRKYVKIDKAGPEANVTAKDETFRRFIDLEGTIKEIPAGRKVKITIDYKDGNPVEMEKEITVENRQNIIKELNTVLRKGIEEGKIPEIKIVAVDKFGNSQESEVDYTESYQLKVLITGERAGKKFVKVSADKGNTTVTINVRKNGQEVAVGTAQVQEANQFVRLTFKGNGSDYRLQSGDELVISGTVTENGKIYTSNPYKRAIR